MEIEKLDREHFLIKELIDSYRNDWQNKQGQRDKENRTYFNVSDVSKCVREIYYLWTQANKKRTIADKTIIFFRHGDLFHDEIQNRWRRQGVVDRAADLEYGLIDHEIDIHGRLDCFAAEYKYLPENNGTVIVEIKTKNPYNFDVEEPTREEVDQWLWYVHCAKNSKAIDRTILDHGYLFYIDRSSIVDPLPFIVWKVFYDEARIQELIQKFIALKKAIDEREIPRRPYERDSIKCQYCRFIEHCWKGIPLAKEPELIPDESVEPPEQELVESMADHYLRLKEEIKEKRGELDKAHETLIKYFVATGTESIPINGQEIVHYFSKETKLDVDYLLSNLKSKWHLIAKPQMKLIQDAIKTGDVDPEIFERAKKVDFQHKIRIKKGGTNADQGNNKPLSPNKAREDSSRNQEKD